MTPCKTKTQKTSLLHALISGFLLLLLTYSVGHAGEFDKIRVVTSVFPPFSYSENGVVKGVAVDQARRMFAELGFDPKIEIYPWARTYTIAEREPNVLIFSMGRNAQRESQFKWVGEITGFDVHIYRAGHRSALQLSSLEDAKDYKVLGLIKDIKSDYLRSQGVDVLDVRSEELGIKMILAGRADLMTSDRNAMNYRLKKMGLDPRAVEPIFPLRELSKPLYAAFSKDTDDSIVERFRDALAKSVIDKSAAD